MAIRGVRRFVRDLLRQRPTRRLDVDPEHDAVLRTAVTLRAARPGAGAPSENFVAALHQRLSAELDGDDGAARSPRPAGRRRFVQAASLAAASAALGAGLDRALTTASAGQPAAAQGADTTLAPNSGEWRTVLTGADLPEGGVRPFDLGSVVGFVRRSGGQVFAVSGVCTHLGCRLALDGAAKRLECPCHNASFAVTGEVLRHQLPIALRPLPLLAARETAEGVQVFAPPHGA